MANEPELDCSAVIHPLPPGLSPVIQTAGDYFEEIQPTPVGYLIWSEFPVTVYIQPPPDQVTPTAREQRLQRWYEAVEQGVMAWNEVLPIQLVKEPERADIRVLRLRPPLEVTVDPETGLLNLGRAATAQTRYQFYLDEQVLSHRFVIHLSPYLSTMQTLATAKHEIGHGLGLWGHSLQEGDVMYFSQVSRPPAISLRDINTLHKLYQQPTCLGTELQVSPSESPMTNSD